VPLYKVDTEEVEGDEELTVLQLKEDRLLAGFVPLLSAPQEPCYTDQHTDLVSGKGTRRFVFALVNATYIIYSSVTFNLPDLTQTTNCPLPDLMPMYRHSLSLGNSSRL